MATRPKEHRCLPDQNQASADKRYDRRFCSHSDHLGMRDKTILLRRRRPSGVAGVLAVAEQFANNPSNNIAYAFLTPKKLAKGCHRDGPKSYSAENIIAKFLSILRAAIK